VAARKRAKARENVMSKTICVRRSQLRHSTRLAGAALLAVLATSCAEEKTPAPGTGRIELSVVGVTDHGLRYRVFGNYTLRGLQNGVLTSVSSLDDTEAAVVRREVPGGLYSVALDPGFVLRPLDASGAPGAAWPAVPALRRPG
jgi:hypothetical protein